MSDRRKKRLSVPFSNTDNYSDAGHTQHKPNVRLAQPFAHHLT